MMEKEMLKQNINKNTNLNTNKIINTNKNIKKIIYFSFIIILLAIFLILIPNLKKNNIEKYVKKDVLKGEELIKLFETVKKNNIKNNSKKRIMKKIKENNKQEITDSFIANFPNNENSVIIKIKIKDKTYSMGELIELGIDKVLDNYREGSFKKETTAKHENGKLSYLYYEYIEKDEK